MDTSRIASFDQIPFLPISFFKSRLVKTGSWPEEVVFTSSGTTGSVVSRHAVRQRHFYLHHSLRIFEHFFGRIDQYHVLALLPSYLEREGSSLIAMARHFIDQSQSPFSGFYLHNLAELHTQLGKLRGSNRKVLLLGVTFALLDFAEQYSMDLSHCMVMETGGMKGRRQELTRQEVHEILQSRLQISNVYSEYGMTELLSQAYSTGEGRFQCPPWMKVLLRDPEDPFDHAEMRQQGAINIIDLANFDSCAFIETQDLGKKDEQGYFEVLGRMDNSDIRGCNLLVR
ncbi:MAG: acyl transferase [Bacteroidota bacterium]